MRPAWPALPRPLPTPDTRLFIPVALSIDGAAPVAGLQATNPNRARRMTKKLDNEMAALVQALAGDAHAPDAAVGQMVERLRRLEEEARLGGSDRQTLQKLASARRLLGDPVEVGTGVLVPFLPD